MSIESDFFKAQLALISKSCPEVAEQYKKELYEQRHRAKFIASENYNSLPVLAAMSGITVDKYAEGCFAKDGKYRRYYSGCEQVDVIEELAAKEACELFGAEYAYVQPCSGSDANLIAYYSIVKKLKEDWANSGNAVKLMQKPKLLSLDVSCGGHLTHSNPMNIVNELFEVYTYGVNENGWIDYNEIDKKAFEIKPDVILAGYSAYPRKLDFKKFREIADHNKCILMADIAHFSGLIAGKVFTGVYDPIPYCDIITSTTQKTLRAGRGGIILAKKEWADYIDKGCPIAMGGPLNNMVASKAIGFAEALKPEFREYAQQVVKNCKVLAEVLMNNGIKLQTDGTDNHLILLNLSNLEITGRQAEQALLDCNIVVNRNSIPNDPNGAWYTSGLRIGPAALTTRGLKEEDMEEFGKLIATVLKNTAPVVNTKGEKSKSKFTVPEQVIAQTKERVEAILNKYPLYLELGDLDDLA